jgi:glycerophosphoryl diester phosphodiesterase
MTVPLPEAFLTRPIAHRALHDTATGRPENSRAAIRAAVAAGYGIEIDLQLTQDEQAVVFHDYDLERLTARRGPVRQIPLEQAAATALRHGDGEGIPSLLEVLEIVAGQVPLLIELKDQDGAMGPDIGPLEAEVCKLLADYNGSVAVMSFNPFSVAELGRLAPELPRGLVTSSYAYEDWPLSRATCDRLRGIPDFDRVGASFISHQVDDLDRARVQDLRTAGVPVLCWTVRSPEAETGARRLADNITFEGYAAPLGA